MIDNYMSVVLSILGFIGSLVSVYVALSNKIKELDIRLRVVEKMDDKIMSKLDDLLEQVTGVKIELQNKVNK